jgi:hypothetical protein
MEPARAHAHNWPTVECLDDNAASEFATGALGGPALAKVEGHLASCRDCRELVAALAGTEADSQAETHRHEKMSESQAGARPMRTLAVGDRVGRYLVLSTLGAGGMGVVHAAYDPQLDRKVALKVLRGNLGGTTSEARKRLRREAQAIAQLSHPNVVGVYDVGATDDGMVYIAMEFVEGDTLTQWLKRWPRTWKEIVEVFVQAARGLVAAHSVGLLHRDFKPDNVLVGGDGRVRVTDFGLARSVLAPEEGAKPAVPTSALHAELTATGAVLGTPRYMPPEQLTGDNIEARSDQFSFCVALYEALYAVHPLPGATAIGMLERGERAMPPPEHAKVPSPIARAVMRGLERDRSKRFPAMASLIAELSPRQERSRVRFAAMGLGALVLVGAAAAAMWSWQPDRAPPRGNESVVEKLEEKLESLERKVKVLTTERDVAQKKLLERDGDVEKLKYEVVEKDTKIEQLLGEIATLHAKVVPVKRSVPTSKAYSDAVAVVQHDIEGCFDEWAQRIDNANRRQVIREVDLVARVAVTPDGVALARDDAALISGSLDDESLKFCVGAQVQRVKYPHAVDRLDVEVQIVWLLPDIVNMSARVTGRHEASSQRIDL